MFFLFWSLFQNGDAVFLKVNLILRIKLETIFARLVDRDSLMCKYFSLAQWTWTRKLLPTADEQRGEKWNSAPSFPLYDYSDQTEEKNKGLRPLLIFNCCLPKSQWFYTDWFMSLTPMTHIAVQLSEKALTLKSNCFKTHAHYVKRVNIYSIIAGSFNTRILYWVKIEQNIFIDEMKHWDILGIPKDDFQTMESTGKN